MTITILHVDDEGSFLEVASHFLRKVGGFDISTALSVEEALTMENDNHYDVIVSDYQMPGKNGIEFLKTLKAQGSETPFILLTGKGREDVAMEALNQGAEYYLQKGVDLKSQFHELASIITQAVQNRRAANDLRESQERFRKLADSISDMFIGLDENLRVNFWNRAAEELLDISSEDALGVGIVELLPKMDDQEVNGKLRKALVASSKETFTAQMTIGGKPSLFEITVYPSEHGLSIFAMDLTGRFVAEKRLSESEERYRALVEASPDGIVVFADGKILYANHAAAQMYGCDRPESLIGTSIMDAILPEYAEESIARIREVTERHVTTSLTETRLKRLDGTIFNVESISSPVIYEGRKAVQTVLRNISERKNHEEALDRVNRKLNLMGSVTRHDSMNQIAILVGWLDAAIEAETDDSIRAYLSKAMDATVKLKKHIEFTAKYRDLGMKQSSWIKLPELLSELTDDLNLKGIAVNVDLGEIEIYADPMLKNVFNNLFENSLAHGENVRKVAISKRLEPEGLVITYEDDGVGIPDNDKEKIFQPGFGSHTGYGLYLNREVLSITGMSIIENGVPGEGARFEIRVPQAGFRIQA